VVQATGFEPGAVAPFPQRAVTRTLMDRALLGHPVLWIGAGSPSHMASLPPPELQRLAAASVLDIATAG
jgi:prolyl-tRNA editing enzyme YbaK/EbsC (Cys-tRNA(Pro) deacylase)